MTLQNRSVDDGIGDVLPAAPPSEDAASSIAAARDAYFRGDFPSCVSMLECHPFDPARGGIDGRFLLARALLRLQRPSEVIELLGALPWTISDVDEVCTARMLHGTAVARVDGADEGLELLASASRLAESRQAHRAIIAEIAYYRGLAHWTKRDLIEASRYATAAAEAELDILSVRAIELQAFVALAGAQYDVALGRFEFAREAYQQCRGRDLALATQILYQIAGLELTLRSSHVLGTHAAPNGRTFPGTAFGPAVATPERMQICAVDARLYALDGDSLSAVRKMHEAIGLAPTPAWSVWALSEGACLFQAIGDPSHARYIAHEAAAIVPSVTWNATTDEERIGLLILAEAFAAVKPEAACEMLERYDRVTSPMDATRLLRDRDGDPRLAAWDAYVRGLVARAGGDHERAGTYLRRAAELFGSCGYLWREALALIELDATPIDTSGDRPLARASRIVLDNFPASFLAARLGSWERACLDPIAGKLTPAQRDILGRMLEGKSRSAIAKETNRAFGTVRKHIENIHAAFGTRSSGELFAACFSRGIITSMPPQADPHAELSQTAQ